MRIDEVVAAGHTRMRLPQWNPHAFVEVYVDPASGALGPWVKIYDVGAGVGDGVPLVFAIWVADEHSEWEPAGLLEGTRT